MLRSPTASHSNVVRTLALFLFLLAPTRVSAQQPCPSVRIPPSNARTNMFSDSQEMDVGDAIAEQVQREFLVAADSANRLHVISIERGEQTGLLFGRRPALSGDSALLSAENDRGELSLYDLQTLTRRQQNFFTHPITYVAFGADQRRMLVLTGDQTVSYLKLPTPAAGCAKCFIGPSDSLRSVAA